jgi:hypothetical protein
MPAQTKSARTSKPPVFAFGLDETLRGLPAGPWDGPCVPAPSAPALAALRALPTDALEETMAMADMVASERSPEARGASLFKEIFSEQDADLARRVRQADDAVRLVSGALTYMVDRKDTKASVRQEGPRVNTVRERVEMVSHIKTKTPPLRGTFTVWAEVCDGDDAMIGVTITRRWRAPVQFTATTVQLLLAEIARRVSLAMR